MKECFIGISQGERGGSWNNNNTNNLRSSNRNNNNGFRLSQRFTYSCKGIFARIYKVTALWSEH